VLPLAASLFRLPVFITKKTVKTGVQQVLVYDLLDEIPVNEIPNENCVSPQFLGKEFTTFFALAVSETTALAEGVEDWFGWLWEVVVMMLLAVVVLVIPCKGEDNLWAEGWVGADLVWAEFTAVAKGGEIAGESVDECLFSRNGVGVVDEENRH